MKQNSLLVVVVMDSFLVAPTTINTMDGFSILLSAKNMDAEAACLILQDFYKEEGQGSYIVYPDPDVVPLEKPHGDDGSVHNMTPEDASERVSIRSV